MATNTFNEENFEKEVLQSKEIVVVDFYADWCGPCKIMSPIIDEIAEEQKNIKVGKINVDDNRELAIKYNVSSIPTIMIFKDGKQEKTFVGVQEKETIVDAINSI